MLTDRNHRFSAYAVTVLVIAAISAACSSGSGGPSTAPSATPSAAAPNQPPATLPAQRVTSGPSAAPTTEEGTICALVTADEVSEATGRHYPSGTAVSNLECLHVSDEDATTVTIGLSGRTIAQTKALFPLGIDETAALGINDTPAYLTNGIPELDVSLCGGGTTGPPASPTAPPARPIAPPACTLFISLGGYPAGPVDQYSTHLLLMARIAFERMMH